MRPGTKIVVYGPSGSGKTTFARTLAGVLGVPHVELDALVHNRPDWNDASVEEFRAAVHEVIAANPNGWVADGNYLSMAGDILLAEADTAIWLRLPFRVVYPRLVRRTFRRAATKELLWGTNRERWRDVFGRESMLIWGISNWREHHAKTREKLRAAPSTLRIVVLTSPGAVSRFLENAQRAAAG